MNRYKNELLAFKNLNIPESDSEAYIEYDKFNSVYNKLEIAKVQNLNCNPLPCLPNKYPIVSKPIINLYGMGLNSKKINNKREFLKEFPSNNFWCEFLDGEHISWDFIIRNGKIEYYTCFFGKKKTFGTFKYWSQINKKEIFPNILLIINKYLINYTGSLNMETLGDKVIEVHLRMGDIKLGDPDVIRLALLNYLDDDIKFNKQLEIVNKKDIIPIHLVPVWERYLIFDVKKIQRKTPFVKKIIEPILQDDDKVEDFYFPSDNNPDKYKRWYLLLVEDLKYGIKLSNKFSKMIKEINP